MGTFIGGVAMRYQEERFPANDMIARGIQIYR